MFVKRDNTIGGQIKGVDSKKGIVEGYLSAWDVIDSDGDMLMRGAFQKSIAERGPKSSNNRKIAFLRAHSIDSPVGKFMELEEDATGLRYVAQMSQSTLGRDTMTLMEEGILNEHSIGYRRLRDKEEMNQDYNAVKEVMLMEGSILTFGANSQTPVIGVKSEDKPEVRKSLYERMEKLAKMIRKGHLTDDSYHLLEIELLQIKQSLESLDVMEPPSTPNNEPTEIYKFSLTV